MLDIDREKSEYFLKLMEAVSRLAPEAQLKLIKKLHYHFFGSPLEVLQIRLMRRWGAK